jgi:hypothetical protein
MAARKARTVPLYHGRSVRGSAFGDVERPRAWLEDSRRKGDRYGIAHWRQSLALTVANMRAEAGDRRAARRLAWRELVVKARQHNEWLVERFRALDAEVARLIRTNGAATCDACSRRLTRARPDREEFAVEIAALPQTVPTYTEYRCREEASAPPPSRLRLIRGGLRRQLEGLGKGER